MRSKFNSLKVGGIHSYNQPQIVRLYMNYEDNDERIN